MWVARRAPLGRTAWLVAMLVGILSWPCAGEARAADSDPAIAAEALFVQGRELMQAGKFDAACPKFERSQELDPGTGTLLNLALCYEKSNRLASAWTAYRAAAASARAAGQNDRETSAREAAEALYPKLARVTVETTVSHEGLVVAIDGTPVPLDAWASGIPADAGERVIAAEAPGREAFETSITVKNGAVVKVKLPRLEPLPEAPATDDRDRGPASTTGSRRREAKAEAEADVLDAPRPEATGVPSATLVLGGLGMVAGGVAAYEYITAREEVDSVDKSVTERRLLIGNIAAAAGGAAIVAAVVVWILSPSSNSTARLPLTFGVTTRRLFVAGTF